MAIGFQRILHHPRALTSSAPSSSPRSPYCVSTDSSSSSRAHLAVVSAGGSYGLSDVSTDSSSSSRSPRALPPETDIMFQRILHHPRALTLGACPGERKESFNGFFIILARSPQRRTTASTTVGVSTDSSSSSRAPPIFLIGGLVLLVQFNGFFIILARSPTMATEDAYIRSTVSTDSSSSSRAHHLPNSRVDSEVWVSTDSSSSSRAHHRAKPRRETSEDWVSTDSSSSSRAHPYPHITFQRRWRCFNGFFIILARSP